MQITRRSPLTGKDNTRELDVTPAEYARWEAGELIQNAMPRLDADDREFILTGLVRGEWEDVLGPEE